MGKQFRKLVIAIPVVILVVCLVAAVVSAVVIAVRPSHITVTPPAGDEQQSTVVSSTTILPQKDDGSSLDDILQHGLPKMLFVLDEDGCPREVIGSRADDVFVFKGIPYAYPPIGPLRWKNPVGFKSLSNCSASPHPHYDAQTFRSECVQLDEEGVQKGSEDCLYVNIWTPSRSEGREQNAVVDLDVMVFIHGGGLMTGSGHAYGSEIAALSRDYNTVFVTFNYRLNAFGFLSLRVLSDSDDCGHSGNYGFMDQILALRWVQQNIRQFGGNPDKVTVFGQGSGATSIYALLATKSVEGLFSRAWLASPSPKFESTAQMAEEQNYEFLNNTSCRSAPPHSVYSCLQSLSSESVVEALAWDKWMNGQFFRMPQIGETSTVIATIDGSLLVRGPIDAWKNGSFIDVPLLIGSTAQETDSNAFSDRPASEWTWHDYEDFIRQIFSPFSGIDWSDILALYPAPPASARYHLSSAPVSRSALTPERIITTAVSDMRAVCPVDEVAKVATHYAQSPVFRYVATFYPGCDDVAENIANQSSPQDPVSVSSGRRVLDKRYAYSGIDVDAFFGVLSDELGSRKFSENVRHAVFSFIRGGAPRSSFSVEVSPLSNGVQRSPALITVLAPNDTTSFVWSTFHDAEYDISTTVHSRKKPRLASDECTYWRENGFYPTYTWMN